MRFLFARRKKRLLPFVYEDRGLVESKKEMKDMYGIRMYTYSLIAALVCNGLWHLTDGGLTFWLASFPVSLLVLPIALWILTRVISECDKGRFRKPSPEEDTREEDTHAPEERMREKLELFS